MNIERLKEHFISALINIVTFGFFHIQGQVQREMTSGADEVKKLRKATYKEWLKQVLLIKWEIDPVPSFSLYRSQCISTCATDTRIERQTFGNSKLILHNL